MNFYEKFSKEHKLNQALIYYNNKYSIEDIESILNNSQHKLNIFKKNNYGNSSVLYAFKTGSVEVVKLLEDYAHKNDIIFDINCKNEYGESPLLLAVCNNDVNMVKFILECATRNKIFLRINDVRNPVSIKYDYYPLFVAVCENNTEIVKLLIQYANDNNAYLKFDQCSSYPQHSVYRKQPLFVAIKNDNIEIVKLLMDYSNLKKEPFVDYEYTRISYALDNRNTEMAELLLEYSIKNKIKLNINEDYNETYLILWTIKNHFIELSKKLIDYSFKYKISLKTYHKEDYLLPYLLQKKEFELLKFVFECTNKYNNNLNLNDTTLPNIDKKNELAFLKFVFECANKYNININLHKTILGYLKKNELELLKLVFECANKYNININLNDKILLYIVEKNELESLKFVLECANEYSNIKLNLNKIVLPYLVEKNELELLKFILKSANKNNNITLNLNETIFYKYNLLLYTIEKQQKELIELIGDYAYDHDITLELIEDDIINPDKIDKDILELLYKFDNKNILNVTYKIHSKLYKQMKRIGKSLDDSSSIASVSSLSSENSFEITELPHDNKNKSTLSLNTENINEYHSNNNNNNNNNNNYNNNNDKISKNERNESEKNENETSDLAIAIYDFKGHHSDEICICKDDYIMVTNWNAKEGWAYGYKKNNPQQKGLFPQFVVKECKKIDEGDLGISLYDFNAKNYNELSIKEGDYVRILDWNFKEGWVYGYKTSKPEEKGALPKFFIQKVDNNINSINSISNSSSNNNNEQTTEYNDGLPTYEETMRQ